MSLPAASSRPSLPIEPLAGHLLSMTVDVARLSRLAFDADFERWLRDALAAPQLSISRRALCANWVVVFDTDAGRVELALDAADWAPLQLALAIEDAPTSTAVVTALLQPWAQVFAPALGGSIVSARRRDESPDSDVATLCVDGLLVGLRQADNNVVDRLEDACRQPPDLSCFAALSLRPRLRVMTRQWTPQLLKSLAAGDVALAGHQQASLRCGVGRVLSAAVFIDPKEFTVQVADHPHMTDDAAVDTTEQLPAGTLDELQLPVAFELDTARISLAVLANMQPGYAVELDVPLREATVRLVCHGQTLGIGQLVAIGGQLGVRITRMEYTHDAVVPG
jgi:type III secretion protein Q